MRLMALDQIHVSAVQADALRPNQQFECGDALAAELLKAHPDKFAKVTTKPAGAKRAPPAANKRAAEPKNKGAA